MCQGRGHETQDLARQQVCRVDLLPQLSCHVTQVYGCDYEKAV